MNKHLHIICLDVPYPPDYGGAFVMFYDIKNLYKAGVKIHLHCFEYGRGEQSELNQYCEEVHYYKRNFSISWLFNLLPFIVTSRKNKLLIQNLSKDDYPVLLEGIHCSWFLYNASLKNRKVLVRLHNVEYQYYGQLAKSAGNILKKIYFLLESKFLKKYEKRLAENALLLALNEKDITTYRKVLGAKNLHYLPVLLSSNEVRSLPGKGTFCLYHGNLSVPENEKAVLWLLQNVVDSLEVELMIAGKNPSTFLQKIISNFSHVRLMANPSREEMNQLIREAHIHLLPSFNITGIKIKLVEALQHGRFVITNKATVEGTSLACLCTLAESPEDFRKAISEIRHSSFTERDIKMREEELGKAFNNDENVQRLLSWIYG